MPVGTIIAGVSAAAAVAGTAASVVSSSAAAKANQKAQKFAQQKADLEAANQRRDTIRQGMAAYADAQQGAENGGVADSSGAAGGQGSIVSQTDSNVSFLDQYKYLSGQQGQAMGVASQDGANAGLFGGIASLGFKGYEMSGGIPGVNKVIGPRPPTATTANG